jgi:hypothetical protein
MGTATLGNGPKRAGYVQFAMHPKLTALGEASLKGWRGRVTGPVADAVSRRTAYSADQVRAVIGLVFFALSVYLLASTVRRALQSEELTDIK